MKKSAGLLSFLLILIVSCHGQSTTREKNDSVLALVKKYLNEKAVDSLYARWAELEAKQYEPG